MRQEFIPKKFGAATIALIDTMNLIIAEYQAQDFVLTVRQLYYQLVSRDIIANTMQEYKRIASIINDGKLAGLIDWDAIEDRTRSFVSQTRWESGQQILRAASQGFHMDMWENQANRVFVVVEKEALVGVLQRVCTQFDIPLLAAKGYPSGSVLYDFAREQLIPAFDRAQGIVVLHLGDHDPSGIDMTRDLEERLSLFAETPVDIHRIALTMDQIDELQPPENPAKTTDSRFASYRKRYGDSSWELDALNPTYLHGLVAQHVQRHIQPSDWQSKLDEIAGIKERIEKTARRFA